VDTQRIILVTGANGGLGTFVTRAFLAAGDVVIGVSKSIQPSDFPSPNFAPIPADLTAPATAAQLTASVVQRFGRIDVLAHIMGGFAGGQPIPETDDATWELMLNLNLRSAINIFRTVIPHMRSARHGSIVAIAGRAAIGPAAHVAAYGASKAALVSLVQSAAAENKNEGITVNAILPGTMDTPANRKSDPKADPSRWVPPQNVADLVLFLASPAAAQITGASIPVYGREG
jgi:NAD(P)-dependent dehydrogenase (short-subunit alcohol dehydrogenase family)